MKKLATATVLAVLLTVNFAFADDQQANSVFPTYEYRFFTGEIYTGYYSGASLHVSGTISNLAEGFPFQVRIGLGYGWVPTGDAVRARRVFIDQATTGSPRSHGKNWDARFDVMYPVNLFSLKRSRVFAGARYSAYTAYFEYIGGNETFDVTANPWGLGGGVETMFALGPQVDMVVSAGADYYFRSTMDGHDTYYRPNGDDLNAKEDFTYKDADACIAQPDLNTRLMLGIAYRF